MKRTLKVQGLKVKKIWFVRTRFTNQIHRILWVQGLQVKWIRQCECESYKWIEADVVSTRIINEMNRTLREQSLQVKWFVKWSGHCEYGGYKGIESDITITKITSEWKRTLWVRGSQNKLTAYWVVRGLQTRRIGRCEYESYKLEESDIVRTMVINETTWALRVQGLQVRRVGHCEYEDQKSN